MGKHTERLELIAIDKLIPYANNARTHSDEQIKKIQASLREFGFVNPVLIDKDCGIIAGHARVEAAKREGLTEVPCVWVEHLTEAQKKAYILADNRLAEDAGWDIELLSVELEELKELDFDIGLTGFGADELSDIFGEEETEVAEDDYEVELPEEPKTKLGDIYQLGRHRLMCGDSTDKATVEKLMNGVKADLGFCDPPYNLGYEYNEYDDNKSEAEYIEFSHNWYQILKDIASRKIVTLGTKNIGIMASLDRISGVACWVKKNWITSCHIAKLQQWEPIFFYGDFLSYKRTSDLFEVNRVYQEDVCEKHTCPKQIKLIADIVENYSNKNETVVDLFGGSGTTLIACEQLNRTCYMMELDPKYCDVIIDRWETLTGEKAVLLNETEVLHDGV